MKNFKKWACGLLALVLVASLPMTSFAASGTTLDISDNGTVDQENVKQMRSELATAASNCYADGSECMVAVGDVASAVSKSETVIFTQSNQVASLVQLGYSNYTDVGPISITKGTLKYKTGWWWTTKTVYLVCMSGTDTDVSNQTTGWWTDLLSGFEQDNKYVRNIKAAIVKNVPANSNIILAGHSLGGMVAQQIAADKDIKKNYNVMNTVTFGSPLIDGLSREGTVKRLGDTSDIVPYASVSTLYNIVWQAAGLNRENGGYSVWDTSFSAHCKSYQRASVWGTYDPVGVKNGARELTLDFSTTRFYHSPVTVTQ